MEIPFYKLIKKIFIWLINGYQIAISPILGHHCRFNTTCSQYGIQSIEKYGIFKGIWITFLRILQCNPLIKYPDNNFQPDSDLNIQDIITMNAQKNLFIIAFILISFILWQTWTTENNSNIINTQKLINVHTSTDLPLHIPHNVPEETVSKNNHIITVITDVFLLKINTCGGNIEEVYLKNYLNNLNSQEPLHLLYQSKEFIYQVKNGLIEINSEINHPFNTEKICYTTPKNQHIFILPENENTLNVTLIHNLKNGIILTKKYTFKKGDYSICVEHIINNNSTKPFTMKLFGNLIQSINYSTLNNENNNNEDNFPLYAYRGSAYFTNQEKYQKYSFSDIKNKSLNIYTDSGWIAMLQKYFVTAWLPSIHTYNTFYTNYYNNKIASINFQSDLISIPPGQSNQFISKLWIGPKTQEKMKKDFLNLDLVIDYGWLWFISQPLFNLLKFIYYYVNNWGISIIIITLIIRLVMYPLTKAQYTSMAKIRMLQPKLTTLQDKYKHDKYQYHQKTLELYKKEKVNPLGGCLPLLIQMPIFLALYYMLSGSVELRHATFIFWIHDLSSKDPYYILPILMGISMFFIQKMSPSTIVDPIQKKIMNIMLIIFTIFFLWFPSGLVLYYVISNIITIIQQQIIYHGLEKKGLHQKIYK